MDSRKINNCNTLLYHLLKYCLVLYLCQEEMVVDLRKQLEEVLSQHSEQLQMRETMCGQQKRKITEHFLHEIKNLNRQCQVLSYHHHHHHCHHHHMQSVGAAEAVTRLHCRVATPAQEVRAGNWNLAR